ncbi:DUF2752 domain-containing protein [Kitasatospora sp. MAP5-34]|uniref:DUF2752 domain-containing protein n=1 Tax=Kitasatospora sp. MAP5-34 TaxID=3035102 RepID=UPI002476B567|nr:DUF2752 domain-containing protein [Kitasatospora sp. MAP5-34]MDH6578124.1 hypothetical protein [Kitasatospora sp. MAP5-34]
MGTDTMNVLTSRWRRSADTTQGAVLRVFARVGASVLAAVAVARLHDAHDPGALCMLRRFTGIPCPACGCTTIFIEAGHGHFGAALAANPVAVVAGLGLLLAPLGPGRWWWELPTVRRNTVLGVVLTLSWAWQLHRYGFLPF